MTKAERTRKAEQIYAKEKGVTVEHAIMALRHDKIIRKEYLGKVK